MRPPVLAAALALALAFCAGCATTLKPTPEARALARNPRATIEGRVTDAQGQPVAGVRVQAIPRGRDVIWSPSEPTDAEGRFRLTLDAPSDYAFLIFVGEVAVVTPLRRDPAQFHILAKPGETTRDVELTLLRAQREELFEPGKPRSSEGSAAPHPPVIPRPAGRGVPDVSATGSLACRAWDSSLSLGMAAGVNDVLRRD